MTQAAETGSSTPAVAQAATAEQAPKAPEPVIHDITLADTKPLPFTRSFSFSWTSDEDGKTYQGTFSCRRITLGDMGQIDVIKARLNGGLEIHPMSDRMHEMMAYCSVALTQTPDWWQPERFYDARLLTMVYYEVRRWEATFRRRVG